MIILPWEKGNGKRSRHAAAGWLDVVQTGGTASCQLPGKLISLQHDRLPVESLGRRRLLSFSRSQNPHTCPCSSATHSRQSRWRSRFRPSRSKTLFPRSRPRPRSHLPAGPVQLKAQGKRLKAPPEPLTHYLTYSLFLLFLLFALVGHSGFEQKTSSFPFL